ncbi:uncharacterized protein LOC100891003 [Strongylocentrotus purpuratus]|uniref:Uncharacterized protein n=1 Tax=Strongylocentrotus purpuratus TaxID=7668 RepID=A0A7M7GHW9_STRPU|nr:uncharacterized protein LOC100891003 [Strongylocentrotus purpuratus]|eukprot:XP_003730516.1 PREDICTED: uncharacterized protein LOC100891003 [Strongylocentrotus purpuratus]
MNAEFSVEKMQCSLGQQFLKPEPTSSVAVPDDLEVVWIKLQPKRLPRSVSTVVVAAIYHPPNAATADTLIDHLLHSMDAIASTHPETGFILLGDYNELDISTLTANRGFRQVVSVPTRGDQILDKIVTNMSVYYNSLTTLPPLGSSDHLAVSWIPTQYSPKPNRTRTRIARPIKDSAIREFGQILQNYDWSPVYQAENTNDKCDTFYSTLLPLIDEYFPLVVVKCHDNDKPWISPKIKALIGARQQAFIAGSNKWKGLRNKVIKLIKGAKSEFYVGRVRKMKESNPSQWHKNIKSMAGNKPSPPAIEVEGIDESDLAAIANTINRFFVSIAEDIDRLDLTDLPTYLPALPLPEIKPWDVYWELQHLNRRKAPGPDSIPARIISEFALELSSPLTAIFNESVRESVVPHRWKRAIVVPIPKASKPTIGDLRPISLTDHFAKILVKSISKWLVGDIGSAIDKSQYGNRKGYSTTHYLIDVLNTIYRNAENPKTVTTLVATDFSKPFDRIDHGLAVSKLLEMGASPSLVAWISSFLSNREQCVRYMSQLSDWMEISAGAPQGTRLGPLIFLCIINDVFKDSDVQCWKYVDDLSLLEFRLIGGTNDAEGRVEILHDGSWGTVCDDSWDLKDAEVVCRMLGFDGAFDAPLGARFGKGSGSIFLDEVQCQGTETDVKRCDHDGIGVHNCAHNEDASDLNAPPKLPERRLTRLSKVSTMKEPCQNQRFRTDEEQISAQQTRIDDNTHDYMDMTPRNKTASTNKDAQIDAYSLHVENKDTDTLPQDDTATVSRAICHDKTCEPM